MPGPGPGPGTEARDPGSWILDPGSWILDQGSWIRILDPSFVIQDPQRGRNTYALEAYPCISGHFLHVKIFQSISASLRLYLRSTKARTLMCAPHALLASLACERGDTLVYGTSRRSLQALLEG